MAEAAVARKGYQKEILITKELNQTFLCSFCELVLRNPVQSFCGHRFCETCLQITKENRTNEKVVCLSCEKEKKCAYSDLKKTFPDLAIKEQLGNIDAKCLNTNCTWKGSFDSYIEHEASCKFQLKLCECGNHIAQCRYKIHKEKQCGLRLEECSHCKVNYIAKNTEDHNKTCCMIPIKCEGCGENIARRQLTKHQEYDTGDCRFRERICPLRCGKLMETSLSSHAFNAHHFELMIRAVLEINKKIDRLTLDENNGAEAYPRKTMQQVSNEIETLTGIFQVLLNEQETARREIYRLENEQELSRNLIQELDEISHNGSFVWKISNFSNVREEAISGRRTAIYSNPFYSSTTGYKMRLKMYPNGDGLALNTYLSLFIVIMKGKYDDILPWPFAQRYRLQLLDQSETNQNPISDIFQPLNVDPFKKPTQNENIGSGSANFVRLRTLEFERPRYISNNTLFIKCVIEQS